MGEKIPFPVDGKSYLLAMADTLDAYCRGHMRLTLEEMDGMAKELREISRTMAPAPTMPVWPRRRVQLGNCTILPFRPYT